MVMTQGCNLEALPKEPQFRTQMKDFPKNHLSELHLLKAKNLFLVLQFYEFIKEINVLCQHILLELL